ncbi:hypothetical protein P3W45_001190 [Vairimorpha bombi]|jgi:hypothetical protein
MNNDIKYEVVKYINGSLNIEEFDKMLLSRDHMRRKFNFLSMALDKKLQNRPSIEDLKNRNIIRNELVIKEIKDELSNLLINRNVGSCNSGYIAPSISELVKKMDFEYKKIVIIHKLNIFRR